MSASPRSNACTAAQPCYTTASILRTVLFFLSRTYYGLGTYLGILHCRHELPPAPVTGHEADWNL